MGLSRNEIIDYALRYIGQDEVTDFPCDGELFCFLEREVMPGKVQKDDAGWTFAGYQVLIEYTLDEDGRPMGKWLWMHFLSLTTFPPQTNAIKLQPPHIVKGQFQNSDRTRDIRMIKVPTHPPRGPRPLKKDAAPQSGDDAGKKKEAKILQFPEIKPSGNDGLVA
jgi:hypothetical protein